MSDADITKMLNYNNKKDYKIDFVIAKEVVVPIVKKEIPLVEPVVEPVVKPMTEQLIPETSSPILTEASK